MGLVGLGVAFVAVVVGLAVYLFVGMEESVVAVLVHSTHLASLAAVGLIGIVDPVETGVVVIVMDSVGNLLDLETWADLACMAVAVWGVVLG